MHNRALSVYLSLMCAFFNNLLFKCWKFVIVGLVCN